MIAPGVRVFQAGVGVAAEVEVRVWVWLEVCGRCKGRVGMGHTVMAILKGVVTGDSTGRGRLARRANQMPNWGGRGWCLVRWLVVRWLVSQEWRLTGKMRESLRSSSPGDASIGSANTKPSMNPKGVSLCAMIRVRSRSVGLHLLQLPLS